MEALFISFVNSKITKRYFSNLGYFILFTIFLILLTCFSFWMADIGHSLRSK